MVWVIASMVIAVTAVTGKTAEISTPASQASALDAAAAISESVLWSFGATGDEGTFPFAGLIADKHGNLYGTTSGGGRENCASSSNGCGTVFELSPPSGKQKQWTEHVLWSFGATSGDGENPFAGLIADREGNLYGTTFTGGTIGFGGTVFELSPPTGKQTQWTENILWSFGASGDGLSPNGVLLADKSGNLYSTTVGGGANGAGTVSELSPPARKQTHWTENLLWSFGETSDDGTTPTAGLIADKGGNLYGTTAEGGGTHSIGTVFELSRP